MLEAVLNGDKKAAQLLAAVVGRDVMVEDVTVNGCYLTEAGVDVSRIGVWIDPIGTKKNFD